MSFSGRTPESLLPRSDSRNPATTCRGITTSGRPCRRGLGQAVSATSASSGSASDAESRFCWQHKDQAEKYNGGQQQQHQFNVKPSGGLKPKTSLDTLIDRVGRINLDDGGNSTITAASTTNCNSIAGNSHGTNPNGGRGKPLLHSSRIHDSSASRPNSHRISGQHQTKPLLAVPEDEEAAGAAATTTNQQKWSRKSSSKPPPHHHHPSSSSYNNRHGHGRRPGSGHGRPPGRSNVAFSWSCCLRADDDDDEELRTAPTTSAAAAAAAAAHHRPSRYSSHQGQGQSQGDNQRYQFDHKHRPMTQVQKPGSNTGGSSSSSSSTAAAAVPIGTGTGTSTTGTTNGVTAVATSRHPITAASTTSTTFPISTPAVPVSDPNSVAVAVAVADRQSLLSLIPQTLNLQITSALLAELSRPISPHDEAGYIYIFWLTPDSDTSPDDETASTLLDDDDGGGGGYNRDRSFTPLSSSPGRTRAAKNDRREAAIQRYASVHGRTNPYTPSRSLQPESSASTSTSTSAPKRTLLLKIGRAQNVHRRMTQWTKQCGQNITLIRYYPHHPNNSTNFGIERGPGTGTGILPQQAPNVARVERLIHLELSEQRAVLGKCEQCGREHREWFEIEATTAGLRGVDEVVRRWVGWAEKRRGQSQDGSGSGSGSGIGSSSSSNSNTEKAQDKKTFQRHRSQEEGQSQGKAQGQGQGQGQGREIRSSQSPLLQLRVPVQVPVPVPVSGQVQQGQGQGKLREDAWPWPWQHQHHSTGGGSTSSTSRDNAGGNGGNDHGGYF